VLGLGTPMVDPSRPIDKAPGMPLPGWSATAGLRRARGCPTLAFDRRLETTIHACSRRSDRPLTEQKVAAQSLYSCGVERYVVSEW
jgi:hypothetical protein